ncbi:MAG: helix-turn-helix transcriptional regulator [Hyphomicrobium sp.]
MQNKPHCLPSNDNRKLLNSVDKLVGLRLRALRVERGLNQEDFGQLLNFSALQVQKYEVGVNRIAAVTLYEISLKLGVELSWFFTGDRHQNQVPALDTSAVAAAGRANPCEESVPRAIVDILAAERG